MVIALLTDSALDITGTWYLKGIVTNEKQNISIRLSTTDSFDMIHV
jgi:hypothetical protein